MRDLFTEKLEVSIISLHLAVVCRFLQQMLQRLLRCDCVEHSSSCLATITSHLTCTLLVIPGIDIITKTTASLLTADLILNGTSLALPVLLILLNLLLDCFLDLLFFGLACLLIFVLVLLRVRFFLCGARFVDFLVALDRNLLHSDISHLKLKLGYGWLKVRLVGFQSLLWKVDWARKLQRQKALVGDF